ncbi:MAG TPA: hypothetical protein VG711_01045 [Phycisphaerales bacterium]|nr:hypothetical protein [Phycisphaerales bacterium]
MVTKDRDLAAMDANLFIDAASVAMILGKGTGVSVRNGMMTINDFDLLEIAQPGQIVAATATGGQVVEILEVVDASTLDVSVPRVSESDSKIPPSESDGVDMNLLSFAPFLAASTTWVLREFRMDQIAEGSTQSEIVANSDSLKRLLLTHAIAEIYASAAAKSADDASLQARATLWKTRLIDQIEQTDLGVDVDGDGRADATRRMNVIILKR